MSGLFFHPTGTCFDDALDYIEELCKADRTIFEGRDFELVHGVCMLPDGTPYAHAWVEHLRKEVHTFGFIGSSDRPGPRAKVVATVEEFYKDFYVTDDRAYYSPLEAWAENDASGHYGPWIERYRQLCREKMA